MTLQSCKLDNKPLLVEYDEYNEFIKAIKLKDVQTIYSKVFGGNFDILSFNRFMFNHLIENYDKYQGKTKEVALCLAEVEKCWNLGSNINIIFISEMLKVSDILNDSL
jgi:hypothetical protein